MTILSSNFIGIMDIECVLANLATTQIEKNLDLSEERSMRNTTGEFNFALINQKHIINKMQEIDDFHP